MGSFLENGLKKVKFLKSFKKKRGLLPPKKGSSPVVQRPPQGHPGRDPEGKRTVPE